MDRAYILSLPPPPPTNTDSDSEDDAANMGGTAKKSADTHYALLLSATTDKKAQIVTRTDGFEKRYLQRCGRCRLPIGYQLDWGQYGEKEGKREDVVYLLPGGLLSTDEMASGKDVAGIIGFAEAGIEA